MYEEGIIRATEIPYDKKKYEGESLGNRFDH